MIREMEKEPSLGLMVQAIQDNGNLVNKMVLVIRKKAMEKKRNKYGVKEKDKLDFN
jgi:hypothetical protein